MSPIPSAGQVVHVRSRRYLVEQVVPPPAPKDQTLVRLACLDDDAQGQALEVLWEREQDAAVITSASWGAVTARGFDNPRWFSAFLHTLRWSCVTATDPRLFQSPYRAGIEIKAYQLEPLRKALLMPRVNLFIADDVGLGKTIEAGLILRELLLRQKVRRVVVAAPPSVVRQWADEMEQRFGLTFVVYDRDFVATQRQERGYQTNPWTTHNRFIISHAVLRDEAYAGPLRAWLSDDAGGPAMLILDEAHNAAPSSGGKYAIDSKLTLTLRDLVGLFDHRLFLSATPHNGHSNSFSALLELLDDQRFCRAVPVKDRRLLDQVMVRRLKQDLREIGETFPLRHVVPVPIDGLPDDAPELALSQLLHAYRTAREQRLADQPRAALNAALLVLISLQKRLLSSVEAFARTLAVHRRAVARLVDAQPAARDLPEAQLQLLMESAGADDARADLPEAEVEAEEDAMAERATLRAAGLPAPDELALLDQMAQIAAGARHRADPKVVWLIDWVRAHLCPALGEPGATWNNRRVLIFTEYTDTKRYLEAQLGAAIEGSDRASERIATFHGGMGEERREAIKLAFNTDPARHPLRILIATDAAREGVNLQNHCADLFHFDVPWNPGRMEQRNGRIDRKLQRAPEVFCHYFVLRQRAEDRVLDTLVRKTRTIQEELGSLSPVVERDLNRLFERGIQLDRADELTNGIHRVDQRKDAVDRQATVTDELEGARDRHQGLVRQLRTLQDLLDKGRDWIRFDERHFRDALSISLELLGAPPLAPVDPRAAAAEPATAQWRLPDLEARAGADVSWSETLDTLRTPRKRGQRPWEWRRESAPRPVIFRDTGNMDGDAVHLHLEHRVVRRLLGRFISQGFVHDELARAAVLLTDEPVPHVVLLGRLSLYGEGAARLHDEIIAVAAEWVPAETRDGRLSTLRERDKEDVLTWVETSLATPRLWDAPEAAKGRLQAHAARDVAELLPTLERRARVIDGRARRLLGERAEREAADILDILDQQRARIDVRLRELASPQQLLGFMSDELRQVRNDQKHLERRLTRIQGEKRTEPDRIRRGYAVTTSRLEPAGLLYLWPVSG